MSKQKIKTFLLFLFLALFLLKSDSVLALMHCNNLASEVENAITKVGLKCPEKTPQEIMGAMFHQETSCGNIKLGNYSVKNCISYRINHCKTCNPAKAEDFCQSHFNKLNEVCRKKLGKSLSDCTTSRDYGMGPAQFQPWTWDRYVKKYQDLIKKELQTDYPDPWNKEHATFMMGLYLKDHEFCDNPSEAIKTYNGSWTYVEKIKWLLTKVGAVVKTIYSDIANKLKELWEHKRDLEIQYPEILGIKPEKVEIGLENYLKYLISWIFILSGLLLFGVMVWSGILYLTSTGQPAKIAEARKKISSGFIGTILLLSVYLLVNYINPELLTFKLPIISPPAEKEPLVGLKEQMVPEEQSKISQEISLGQALQKGLLEEEKVKAATTNLENFEKSITQPAKINPIFDKISDLSKYLEKLTNDCHCENLKGLCTKVKNFSMPVGCLGDICSKETRKRINRTLALNEEKVETLTKWQKKLPKDKNYFQEELRKLSYLEEELLNCQTQMGILDFHRHLAESQKYKEIPHGPWKLSEIPNYYPAAADPLTFYCPAGGTIYETQTKSKGVQLLYSDLTCPKEIKLGELLSKNRELAILTITKYEELNHWIEEEAKEIQNMEEYVSQCNRQACNVTCLCVPNPCFTKCAHFCKPFCKSPCLQAIGGCHGEPCPRKEINETSEKIKKAEDEVFLSLNELNSILPAATALLEDKEEELSLAKLREEVIDCTQAGLILLRCQDVIGHIGPEGKITQCHPQNLFCCLPPEKPPELLETFAYPPIYVPPNHRQLFPEPPIIDNCPKAWICHDEVKKFKQYQEASPALKEFLACFRDRLDQIKKEKELEFDLAKKIVSISDSKLLREGQEGTCNWSLGPLKPNGCSHPYQISKQGKKTISCHYGGTECWPDKLSYAVDISLEDPLDKRYLEDTIKAAKECEPRVWLDLEGKGEVLHLSIGAIYGCGCQ